MSRNKYFESNGAALDMSAELLSMLYEYRSNGELGDYIAPVFGNETEYADIYAKLEQHIAKNTTQWGRACNTALFNLIDDLTAYCEKRAFSDGVKMGAWLADELSSNRNRVNGEKRESGE